MFDQHEREELDRIERWFKLADPALVRAFEGRGHLPGEHRGWTIALRAGAYAVAAVVLIVGVVSLNILLFMLGSVCLAMAGCVHLCIWLRGRRLRGWSS